MRIDADLDITIDGRAARLHGSGRVLRLEVEEAAVLRQLAASMARPKRDIGALLASQGLTVEVADRKGLLLIVGAGAKPGPLNRFTGSKHVQPASYGAVLRLVLNT